MKCNCANSLHINFHQVIIGKISNSCYQYFVYGCVKNRIFFLVSIKRICISICNSRRSVSYSKKKTRLCTNTHTHTYQYKHTTKFPYALHARNNIHLTGAVLLVAVQISIVVGSVGFCSHGSWLHLSFPRILLSALHLTYLKTYVYETRNVLLLYVIQPNAYVHHMYVSMSLR